MPTIDVKDAAGVTRTINTIPNAGQAANAASQPVALSAEQDTKLDTIVTALTNLLAELQAKPETTSSDFAPRYSRNNDGGRNPATDPDGNLVTRAQALTDEGTWRANFANASLAVALGSVTIAGAVVTGTFPDTLDLQPGDYFKLDADAETAWTQVETVDTLGQLTLIAAYVGGASGAASRAKLKPTTGSGGSITIGTGQATLVSGTTTAAVTSLMRLVDYAPLVFRFRASISARNANQAILIGAREDAATPRWFARFRVDGVTATTVICETGCNPTGAPSASETESTTITLPNGLTSAILNDWRVEQLTEYVRFYVAGILVAEHSRVVPMQHDVMLAGIEVVNATAPSTATVVCDYMTGKNHNKLEVGIMSDTERLVAALPPAQTFSYNVAGVIAINTDLLIIDCSQFASLSIQCASMGTTGVVTVAWCNEPTFAVPVTASLDDQAGATTTTMSAAGLRIVNRLARYCRLRLTTATTAGTTTFSVAGFSTPSAPPKTTQPISGSLSANQSTNVAQINGVTPLMGNGATGTGSPRVTIASDTTANSNPWLQTPVASAAQGAGTTHHAISAASTNATSVKASAGTVNTLSCSNTNAAARYLKLYNKASAPTVGTDTPVATILLRPGENTPVDCGAFGRRFTTGIAYAITTGIAVADTGAVAASEHAVEMTYT